MEDSWYIVPSETADKTPPDLRWNMFFSWDQTLITCQKLGLRASPRIPNTWKQMNAVSVAQCLAHEPLAFFFDINLNIYFKWNWRRIKATHSKQRGIVWSTWSWIFVSYFVQITFLKDGKPFFLVSFWRLCGSLLHCNFLNFSCRWSNCQIRTTSEPWKTLYR